MAPSETERSPLHAASNEERVQEDETKSRRSSSSSASSSSFSVSSSESSEPETSCFRSTYGRRAMRNIVSTVLLGAGTVAVVSRTGAWDPGACLASFYVLGLFCFQNWFQEWPRLERRMAGLLVAAVSVMLLPTVLQAAGHNHVVFGPWWPAMLAADLVLILATYRYMVRGPAWIPPPGSLQGQVCIVTGCNCGIGYETAEVLALAGATLVFACRSEARAREAMAKLLQRTSSRGVEEKQLRFIALDLSSLKSVRRFAAEFAATGLSLHLLILNAGVMLRTRTLSEDGFEMTLSASHFGHFLLTKLLLPHLLKAEAAGAKPRVVVVGSNMSYVPDGFDFGEAVCVRTDEEKQSFLQKPYTLFRAYGQAKLANILFATELDRRLRKQGSRIPVNVVHPGEVLTEVMRDMHPFLVWLKKTFKFFALCLMKTPRQGSYCTVYVASAPELATSDGASGAYFIRLAPAQANEAGCDEAAGRRLWEISERLTAERG